ncbi:MAG: JAB domain-containing protein [Deltaproteobacteria bacterium]|jgi:DNA repair protein RadC|nr:JAB domain-containing protein [Deltaproteobacteria bacterium]MBT4090129.1 JAB domain-containing protein [Deltaproteobacteria bacterium]MBT4264818.1 JAB domain-containing protein [Deltaproteobacteria bacterium]MBT4640096.1 JAB domain-containing protein [Deltaproteobacteria bacterium]MBT6613426.1 JAB domain-containing protein [Deltaproteobacteria bacterium]
MVKLMIEDFYALLTEWLQQKDYLTIINSTCYPLINSPEKNPDYKTLWDRFLKSLLPKNYQYFISLHPYLLESFVVDLTTLSQYTVQQRVTKLIERSFFNILPDMDQTIIKSRILDFHSQLDRWADGSWHQQIQMDRSGAIDKLQRHAGFENDWDTAAFLADCGYWYPSSRASLKAWNKFSGNTSSPTELFEWWDLLKKIATEPKKLFALDFTFERTFGARAIPGMPTFCITPAACFECPLNTDCSYYKASVKLNPGINLENLIRMDDINKIETTQLISYLAGERWTESPFQKRLINNYPELLQALSADVHPGSDDERLVLFLKGLQAISERSESRKTITDSVVFCKSDIIFKELRFELAKQKQEAFYTLILDNKHRKILLKLITRGTLNQSLVHPREVFAPAIQLRAAAVILIHNHPSGDPHPSSQDIDITKRLIEVGNIVGINVLDHVIIGQETYFSFADEELM